MNRHSEGTSRTARAASLHAASTCPLLSACLVALAALALAAALVVSPALPASAWADTSVDVEVTVDVSKTDPDDPEPPQTYTAKVLVLDASGKAVAGARVTVAGGSSSQTTGADGTVGVNGLEQGATYAVTAAKAGYAPASGTFLCRGVANEVWPLVLKAEDGGRNPDPGPKPNPDPKPNPGPAPDPKPNPNANPSTPVSGGGVSNPYTTVSVDDASAKPADDKEASDKNASTPGGKDNKKDAEKSTSPAPATPSSGNAICGFPWWLLILAFIVGALFMWFIIILFKRRKKDEEEDEDENEDEEEDDPTIDPTIDPIIDPASEPIPVVAAARPDVSRETSVPDSEPESEAEPFAAFDATSSPARRATRHKRDQRRNRGRR